MKEKPDLKVAILVIAAGIVAYVFGVVSGYILGMTR